MTETEDPVKALREAIGRIVYTADGLTLFQWLVEICGYNQRSIVADPGGEINTQSTIYNEARRNVWLDIMPMLPYEKVAEIVIPPQPKQEEPTDDRTDDTDE